MLRRLLDPAHLGCRIGASVVFNDECAEQLESRQFGTSEQSAQAPPYARTVCSAQSAFRSQSSKSLINARDESVCRCAIAKLLLKHHKTLSETLINQSRKGRRKDGDGLRPEVFGLRGVIPNTFGPTLVICRRQLMGCKGNRRKCLFQT
jgi:hypothetical protein